MSIYKYENTLDDMNDAKSRLKNIQKDADAVDKKTDGVVSSAANVAKEDGEDRIRAFLDSIKASEQKEKERLRHQTDPTIKQRVLASQSNECRKQCVDHMLGTVYIKSLPLDDDFKQAHNAELRNDFSKYINNNKGGALYYVKDANEKCNGTNIYAKKILEAAEAEVRNFHDIMGIDFKGKNADDIKFNLDNEIKTRLDKVTDEVSFDDITNGIRTNVTNVAIAEIDRAKKEAEEQQALEDELAKNTDVTTEAAAEEWLKKRSTKTRSKFYQPSLFEAMLMNKTVTMTESASDFDEIFAEAVKDYTMVSIGHSIGFEKISPREVQRMANSLIR